MSNLKIVFNLDLRMYNLRTLLSVGLTSLWAPHDDRCKLRPNSTWQLIQIQWAIYRVVSFGTGPLLSDDWSRRTYGVGCPHCMSYGCYSRIPRACLDSVNCKTSTLYIFWHILKHWAVYIPTYLSDNWSNLIFGSGLAQKLLLENKPQFQFFWTSEFRF